MAVALCLAFGASARADDGLPQPKGPVVLVITGDIARSNGPNRASFDIDMLKQIGMTSLVTSTPWTEGTSKFEGVLARDVLRYVGARSDHITAISMNDYLVEIPIKDFVDHDVIFALKRDGKFLGVRDMGPVLIVYPFDRDASLWTESVFTRCVLQLGAVYVGTPGTVPLASLLPGDQTPIYSTVRARDVAGGNDNGGTVVAATGGAEPIVDRGRTRPNGSLNGGRARALASVALAGRRWTQPTPSGGKNPTAMAEPIRRAFGWRIAEPAIAGLLAVRPRGDSDMIRDQASPVPRLTSQTANDRPHRQVSRHGQPLGRTDRRPIASSPAADPVGPTANPPA